MTNLLFRFTWHIKILNTRYISKRSCHIHTVNIKISRIIILRDILPGNEESVQSLRRNLEPMICMKASPRRFLWQRIKGLLTWSLRALCLCSARSLSVHNGSPALWIHTLDRPTTSKPLFPKELSERIRREAVSTYFPFFYLNEKCHCAIYPVLVHVWLFNSLFTE